MSRRANPTVIGAFVLGAAAIAVLAVIVLGGGRFFQRSVTFVMAFSEVSGLSVGAPVMVKGVQVGQVTRIQLRYGSELIAVYAEFHPDRVEGNPAGFSTQAGVLERIKRLVERGMRAQLATQSFVTGQLYVSLDFHPGAPATFTQIDPDVAEIPTIPTQLAQLQDQLKRLIGDLEKLPLQQIVASALATVESFGTLARSPEVKRAVAEVAPTLESLRVLARDLDQKIDPVAVSLQATLAEARVAIADLSAEARRLVGDVDREVGPLAANLGRTSDSARALLDDARKTVSTLDREIGTLGASLRDTSDAARRTMVAAQGTLERADGMFDDTTPLGYELAHALTEVSRAARSLRSLADTVDRQPNILIFGREAGQ